jgi:hypothetical protein
MGQARRLCSPFSIPRGRDFEVVAGGRGSPEGMHGLSRLRISVRNVLIDSPNFPQKHSPDIAAYVKCPTTA